jgi:glycosyltransferase involved in cell wall biosynthesis
MNYFVNCTADKELEIYFKNDNFTIIQNINEVDTSKNNINVNIVYGSDDTPVFNRKISTITNILLLTKPVINVKILDKFDFILPTSLLLFSANINTIGFKLLLPININNSEHWNKYYSGDKFFRGYRSDINYIKGCKDTCSIFVYYDIEELDGIEINNTKLLKVNPVIKKTLYTLNNYLCLGDTLTKSHISGIPYTTPYKVIRVKHYDMSVDIKRGVYYLIVRDGFNDGNNQNISKIIDNYIKRGFGFVSFHVSGKCDPEYAILCNSTKNKNTSVNNLLSHVEYHDRRCIGYNTTELEDKYVYNMYNTYGSHNMYSFYNHLIDIQDIYYDVLINYVRKINIIESQQINKHKFIRILAFWSGANHYPIDINDIIKFINAHNYFFEQKKILLLSKNILSYGGNQKTALQMYHELMTTGYDVRIGCITSEELISSIDKNDVIHMENIAHAITEANSGSYDMIIINKLDEFVEMSSQTKAKCIFITHNSMDPVNERLIRYSGNFHKILTINHHHTSLMYNNTINIPVTQYLNYDTCKTLQTNPRDKMKYTITFIGRISDEKNLLLLLDAFNQYNSRDNKLTLNVIGDGKLDITYHTSNKYINFIGRADYNQIMYYLYNSDYLISTSCTEGLPFVFLEAFSIGIPVISSNIVGCNEIISDSNTGFLFNYKHYNYNKNAMNITDGKWNIFSVMARNTGENIKNIVNALGRAYAISIDEWTCMSNNCYKYYNDNFNTVVNLRYNMNTLINNNTVAIQCTDCEPYFKSIFKNIDIVEKIDNTKTYDYDIVLKIASFDIFCKRLSLLHNNKTNIYNCKKMSTSLSRLYKLRKEMLDKGIGILVDGKNQLVVGKGDQLDVKDIQHYI